MCVIGGGESLGDWDAAAAVRMTWTEGDVWTAEADLPVGAPVEYKYIVRSTDTGDVVEWQACANLVIDLGTAGTDTAVAARDEWDGAHELVAGSGGEEAQAEGAEAPEVAAAAPAAKATAAAAAVAEAESSAPEAAAPAAATEPGEPRAAAPIGGAAAPVAAAVEPVAAIPEEAVAAVGGDEAAAKAVAALAAAATALAVAASESPLVTQTLGELRELF